MQGDPGERGPQVCTFVVAYAQINFAIVVKGFPGLPGPTGPSGRKGPRVQFYSNILI